MTASNKSAPFKNFFNSYLLSNAEHFARKIVVDFPAGSGETSQTLRQIGSVVIPFDLFPEYFKVNELECKRVNIMDGIPLSDNSVDIVICQEGIEHFSNQLFALQEFNRILKKNGFLIITTPNYSNLRSKISYLLSESERFGSIMPSNELDSVWMSARSITKEMYYGHVFLIGIQKLRMLAKISGFNIFRINHESVKSTSLFFLLFLYPFIVFFNYLAYRKNLSRKNGHSFEDKKKVYKELFRLGIDPKILVDGTLFVEFEKTQELNDVPLKLKNIHTSFDVPT